MRSILLHISDDDCLEARMQVALDLARAFDGHVTCLQAVPVAMAVPGIYGAYVADLVPVMRDAAGSLREKCEARLAGEDVVWSWIDEDGSAWDVLLRRGALSDVVVIGSHEPFQTGASTLAGHLALKGRTPLMVVPQGTRSLDYSGSAIIAWNGSGEAARALKAATPLLSRASSVVIAEVGVGSVDKLELSSTEAAEYLSRHDISCEIVEFPHEGRPVPEVLKNAAKAREAAYLVMGSYGLPRIVEAVLGGVTRDLLAHPPAPIFTCH